MLETKIDELIAALDRNTAARNGNPADTGAVPAPRGPGRPKKTTEAAPTTGPVTQAASAPAVSPVAAIQPPTPPLGGAAPVSVPAVEAAGPAPTSADLAKLITDLATKDRAAAVNLLAKYGATALPQLKQNDYAAFAQDVNNVLNVASGAPAANLLY